MRMKTTIDRLLTLDDLTEIFPRSKWSIRQYLKGLPVVRIGRTPYWQESVIRDFIEAHTERRETHDQK